MGNYALTIALLLVIPGLSKATNPPHTPDKVIRTLAHMACTEAGENWKEVRAVLSVALNRSRNWERDIYSVVVQKKPVCSYGVP